MYSEDQMKHETAVAIAKWVVGGVLVFIGFGFFGSCYIHPQWNVWARGLAGQAALKQAEQEKLIMVEQAKAEVAAAELRAKAIELVGAAAQKYPEYRYQEFLGAFGEALTTGRIHQIVYIPTEAGIPILEARPR